MKYRNIETGEIVEGELEVWDGFFKFNGMFYLTKRHFKLNWEEVK